MQVTIVGSGAAAPSATRVQAGVYVSAADVRLLVDCGSGVAHRMAGLGLDWSGITHLALTHFHADHLSDLATLFVAWRYGQLPPRSAPLQVLGPPGTIERVRAVCAALGVDASTYGFPITTIELRPGVAVPLSHEVSLTATKVPHTPESVAYCLTHAGRRAVISGDLSYDEAFADWARDVDLLVIECSLPAAMAVPTHLTPDEVGRLAARARPQRLVCTHLYPPLEGTDVAGEIARHFGGSVTVGYDGWTATL